MQGQEKRRCSRNNRRSKCRRSRVSRSIDRSSSSHRPVKWRGAHGRGGGRRGRESGRVGGGGGRGVLHSHCPALGVAETLGLPNLRSRSRMLVGLVGVGAE